MNDVVRSYWSILTGTDHEPGPYEDTLGAKYVYNSNVPNHLNLRRGDVLVVRTKSAVIGTGVIDEVRPWEASIAMRLCPSCGRAKVQPRKTKLPRFTCQICKAEFDEPRTEERAGTWFEALYASRWEEFAEPPTLDELAATFAGGRGQNAIDRLDPTRAVELLSAHATMAQLSEVFDDIDPVREIRGGHTERTTRVRRGQKAFRDELIKRFGENCAITGPCPAAAMEAAHLVSFARTGRHDVAEGLLLRADLHRLLDAGLLAIDTATWTIVLAPKLRGHSVIGGLHGASLTVPERLRPNPDPLREHLRVCEERW